MLVIPAQAGIHLDLDSIPQKAARTMEKQPCVYIMASSERGTLYVGVTSDLIKRIWQHKNDMVEGFTKTHRVHMLVWYELHGSMESAIGREKAIKEWKRAWKIELIEQANPNWCDLYDELTRAQQYLQNQNGFRLSPE
jgi:putative endonuclease